MVTRRVKKGSVYDALASSSGLDFSPVVQLKTFNTKKHERTPEMEDDSKKEIDISAHLIASPPKPPSPKPTTGQIKVDKCLTAHEKYPSWPVVDSESSSLPYRSHSWTSQTDYPKEKVGYSRPKKTHQYKISTNQLQPVLERGTSAEVPERRRSTEGYRVSKGNKQFDFEGFHTPCIPKCYSSVNAPPEKENSAKEESNTFLSRYEDVLRQQVQYTTPPPPPKKNNVPDTPFLDRLRLENAWAGPRPDFENSSENGTWMDSMESSSHGRNAKWQGSSSDLSTLSTQLSNRSSLFDSGHSTMPESGRLSPQSSCDSLLLEGPTRAQVVARHGCHREIVAHSARVQQPERYGSESVLYYATGSTVSPTKHGTAPSPDEGLYSSHASLNLNTSQKLENDLGKSPSRVSSNSFSSEDSITRAKYVVGEDTSGSSSDVSNITCISNYNSLGKPVSVNTTADAAAKLKPIIEPPKPKKSIDETTRKFIFPEVAKRQRVSDPDLKAIQKQAVMSFYQRMSLAESIKSEGKPPSGQDSEPPPPYDAVCSLKKKMPPPKLSLPPKSQWPPRSISHTSPQIEQHPKFLDAGLSTNHSKSVPNLVALKGQSLDSRPVEKHTLPPRNRAQMMIDKIISWDQLPGVLDKKVKPTDKASPDNVDKCGEDDDHLGDISSGYMKGLRKVHLKEVENSNKVQVVITENVGQSTKRRPAPPPPPKQPPKRPPPPPPPITPPQVVVHITDNNRKEASLVPETKEDESNSSDGHKISDNSSLIYPKNSYMSYKSERKMSRQGFDGKYRRSSAELTCVESNNFEQLHNIRQHGSTVIFHSGVNNNCEKPDDSCVKFQLPSPETNSECIINCSLDNEADLNQNSVEISNLPPTDPNDLTRRVIVSRLHRKTEKTKEESECEKLSKEYVETFGCAVLRSLLVPSLNQKKMSDFMKGILNVEFEQNGFDDSETNASQFQENQREDRRTNCQKTCSVSKTNLQTNHVDMNDNQNMEEKHKKEELVHSIGKKIESLKALHTNIRSDIDENEQLGKDITNRLKELAKPNEIDKFLLHVEETEKIVNLLVCLANRLAKAENMVNNQTKDCHKDDMRALEAKRDKLREQIEDACRLKENIDRRSNQVSTFLQKYFSEDEYASYNFFIKMKIKLIVDVRDVDDRINLGEEQLAYLNLVANFWRSIST